MMLLSEALDKLSKLISIQVPVQMITPELADEITAIVKNEGGNCRLRVVMYDMDNKLTLDMLSGKFKVKCSSFIKEIKKFPAIGYKIS
jgi:hypothetical protein